MNQTRRLVLGTPKPRKNIFVKSRNAKRRKNRRNSRKKSARLKRRRRSIRRASSRGKRLCIRFSRPRSVWRRRKRKKKKRSKRNGLRKNKKTKKIKLKLLPKRLSNESSSRNKTQSCKVISDRCPRRDSR